MRTLALTYYLTIVLAALYSAVMLAPRILENTGPPYAGWLCLAFLAVAAYNIARTITTITEKQ